MSTTADHALTTIAATTEDIPTTKHVSTAMSSTGTTPHQTTNVKTDSHPSSYGPLSTLRTQSSSSSIPAIPRTTTLPSNPTSPVNPELLRTTIADTDLSTTLTTSINAETIMTENPNISTKLPQLETDESFTQLKTKIPITMVTELGPEKPHTFTTTTETEHVTKSPGTSHSMTSEQVTKTQLPTSRTLITEILTKNPVISKEQTTEQETKFTDTSRDY